MKFTRYTPAAQSTSPLLSEMVPGTSPRVRSELKSWWLRPSGKMRPSLQVSSHLSMPLPSHWTCAEVCFVSFNPANTQKTASDPNKRNMDYNGNSNLLLPEPTSLNFGEIQRFCMKRISQFLGSRETSQAPSPTFPHHGIFLCRDLGHQHLIVH